MNEDNFDSDDISIAEFLSNLSYQNVDSRNDYLENSIYGQDLYIDRNYNSDNFVAVHSRSTKRTYHVYRGSATRQDFVTDIHLAFGNLTNTNRYQEGYTNSEQSRGVKGRQIVHVGHSLGGTIADLVSREFNEKSISFNQGSTPIFDYGQADKEKHIQLRMSNDIVSNWTKGDVVTFQSEKHPIRFLTPAASNISSSQIMKHYQPGGLAGRIGESIMSHFLSNFATNRNKKNS